MHASCGFFNSGFETAACVIADGAGSFLQIGELEKPTYEFETIFKAEYPLKFETVYRHLGTQVPVGIKQISTEPMDVGQFEQVIPSKNSEQILTEYPGLTKVYEAVTKYCGFDTIDAGKTMGLSPYGKDNPEMPDLFKDGWANRDVFIPMYPAGADVNLGRFKIFDEDVRKVSTLKFKRILHGNAKNKLKNV